MGPWVYGSGLVGLEFSYIRLLEIAMKRFQLITVFCLSLVMLFPATGHAVDLFGVDVTYGGGTISQTASSLPDLVEAVVNITGLNITPEQL